MSDAATPSTVAAAMRKEAMRNTGKAPTFRIFNGWKLGLSYGPVPLPPNREMVDRLKGSLSARIGDPRLGSATYEQLAEANDVAEKSRLLAQQWIFSACLHPRGRSSTEADWTFLGQMVGAMGAPVASCRTPLDTTHPNDVLYWLWIDPDALS